MQGFARKRNVLWVMTPLFFLLKGGHDQHKKHINKRADSEKADMPPAPFRDPWLLSLKKCLAYYAN